jgi:hypothetical protein
MVPMLFLRGMLYVLPPTTRVLPQVTAPALHSAISKVVVAPDPTWNINGENTPGGQGVSVLDFMQPIKAPTLLYTSTLYMPKMLPSLQLRAVPWERQRRGTWPFPPLPSYRATGKAGLEQVVPDQQLTKVPVAVLACSISPDGQEFPLAWQPVMVPLAVKEGVG